MGNLLVIYFLNGILELRLIPEIFQSEEELLGSKALVAPQTLIINFISGSYVYSSRMALYMVFQYL